MTDNKKFDLDEIMTFFKTINPNKSQSTYSTMRYNLLRIPKMTKIAFINTTESVLQPDFLEIPMSTYSVNTQIQSILGIELWIKYKIAKLSVGSKIKIARYNALKDKWDVLLKALCNKKNDTINQNVMTCAEKENWIDYSKLRRIWEKVVEDKLDQNDNSFTSLRDLTLTSLFILLPPTRIGNYETMRIRFMKKTGVKTLKQDRNYLMIDNNAEGNKYTICFNRYKTAKYIGQIIDTVTDPLMIKLLDEYLKIRLNLVPINKHKYNDTDTLFINNEKKQISQSYITETLKKTTNKYIGKKLSCDMFRKIFLTWFLSDENKSIADRKKMAHFMGQTYSPATAETYRKIPPPENKPIILNFD